MPTEKAVSSSVDSSQSRGLYPSGWCSWRDPLSMDPFRCLRRDPFRRELFMRWNEVFSLLSRSVLCCSLVVYLIWPRRSSICRFLLRFLWTLDYCLIIPVFQDRWSLCSRIFFGSTAFEFLRLFMLSLTSSRLWVPCGFDILLLSKWLMFSLFSSNDNLISFLLIFSNFSFPPFYCWSFKMPWFSSKIESISFSTSTCIFSGFLIPS